MEGTVDVDRSKLYRDASYTLTLILKVIRKIYRKQGSILYFRPLCMLARARDKSDILDTLRGRAMRMIKEEAEHLLRGVGPLRIGV